MVWRILRSLILTDVFLAGGAVRSEGSIGLADVIQGGDGARLAFEAPLDFMRIALASGAC